MEPSNESPPAEAAPGGAVLAVPGPGPTREPYASPQQLLYARWLDIGTRVSFVLLVAAFALYVSGVLPAYVPLTALPQAWGLPVDRYLAAVNAPNGWGWARLVMHGDYLNVAAVAMLTAVTIACHLPLIVAYRAQRDNVYLAIVVAQIIVLLAAASGVLGGAR
jgi:hypothetical protein